MRRNTDYPGHFPDVRKMVVNDTGGLLNNQGEIR